MELAFKKQGFIIYKLIPCLIITMFAFMCLYGSSVYASNEENNNLYTIYDTNYVVDLSPLDGYHYFFMACKFDNPICSYFLVLSTSTIYCSDPLTNNYTTFSSDSPIFATYGTALASNGSFQDTLNNSISHLNKSTEYSSSIPAREYATNNTYSLSDIPYACSYNILNSENKILFQAPLQAQPTIVASQVGEVEMNKTLQEILGILPVVIVVLVGLIAIRKAIQFLMAIMKKA